MFDCACMYNTFSYYVWEEDNKNWIENERM